MEDFSKLADRYRKSSEIKLRLSALTKYDLSFVTECLNEDLIRSGRAYSCEQAYPLREKIWPL